MDLCICSDDFNPDSCSGQAGAICSVSEAMQVGPRGNLLALPQGAFPAATPELLGVCTGLHLEILFPGASGRPSACPLQSDGSGVEV